MRYKQNDDEDWDNDNSDASYDDDAYDSYDEDSDSEPTRDCPSCGFEMLEICVQCPSCGQWLSQEDTPSRGQPRWVIVGALICLATLLSLLLLQF
jgi:lipopolysaccharide biosynthesis regulator YciM